MKTRLHLAAGILATSVIAVFLVATILVELFGSQETVAEVKALIVAPGLWILIQAIAATGGSGFSLAQTRQGRLVENKKRRMPFIAANGILVLVPAAIFLNLWATQGLFDVRFYLVQALELVAGAVNLTLMGLNIRDGLQLAGRWRAPPG